MSSRTVNIILFVLFFIGLVFSTGTSVQFAQTPTPTPAVSGTCQNYTCGSCVNNLTTCTGTDSVTGGSCSFHLDCRPTDSSCTPGCGNFIGFCPDPQRCLGLIEGTSCRYCVTPLCNPGEQSGACTGPSGCPGIPTCDSNHNWFCNETCPNNTYSISGSVRECILEVSGWINQPLTGSVTTTLNGGNPQTGNSYTYTSLPSGSSNILHVSGGVAGFDGPFRNCPDPSTSNDWQIPVPPSTQQNIYFKRIPECPNGVCSGIETCSNCPQDCGQCPLPSPTPTPLPSPTPTPIPQGTYLLDCTNITSTTATMTIAGSPSCTGCSNGFDNTTQQWAWLGASVPSGNTVRTGNSITGLVNGIAAQNSPKTCTFTGTGTGPTPTPIINPPQRGYTAWVRFWNKDSVTPYNGPDTFSLLTDSQNFGVTQWTGTDFRGNNHNVLFYGLDGTYPHNTNQNVGICERTLWHPYDDPGYQINADGTLSGCPSQNLNTCCTGPSGTCSETCGYNCSVAGVAGDCFVGDCYQCPDGVGPCRFSCDVNKSDDVCVDKTASSDVFPRCFSPAPGAPRAISANTHFGPGGRWVGFEIHWDELAPPLIATNANIDPTTQVQRILSIGGPSGAKLRIYEVCSDSRCPGFNTRVLDPERNPIPASGPFAKDFEQTFGTTGLKNYWASDWQKPDGNTGYYVYDVIIPGVYSISGNVYTDNNKNQIKDGTEANYGGAITITASSGTLTYPATGAYQVSNLIAGTYTISYTNPPTAQGYRMTFPLNGPPPSFSVAVGAGCSPQTPPGSTCTSGSIANLNFGITNSNPWWQCRGSDCRSDAGINNPIPSTASCGGPYASVSSPSSNNTPGIVFSGDSSYNFGQGQASPNPYNWVVGGSINPEVFTPVNAGVIRTSYSYLLTTARQSGITPTDLATVCSLSSCTLPLGLANGVYKAEGNVLLNAHTFTGGKNYVFLVNGTLTILGNIRVDVGSTATFSVSGDISVDRSVGETSITSDASNVEGFFSTDRNFIIEGINNCVAGPDKRLNIAGSVVVNAALGGGTLQNNRDLCGGNLTCPTYTSVVRPDFLLNAPAFVRAQNYIWQEAAP